MLREVKPRNARSARALKQRAPRENEHAKKCLFLKSSKCSELINTVARDIYTLKKPLAVRFVKKNEGVHPFEDPSSLEFFSNKNDSSLLCLSSHNKKRPHALTFIRCFHSKVLDILETTVDPNTVRTMAQFHSSKSVRTGLKPMLSFSGAAFEEGVGGENGSRFQLMKSLMLDLFRGEEVKEVDVEGLQELISFAASEEEIGSEAVPKVHMRVWRLVTKRSGQKVPRVELEEIGPRVDFRLRRIRDADPALWKEAMKKARGTEPRTKKNIDMDALGDKTGRIHLGKQDLGQLQTRKMKGLKRSRGGEDSDDEGVPSSRREANGDHEMENGAADEDIFEDDEETDDDDGGSNPFDSDDSGGVEFIDEAEGDGGDIEMETVSEGGDGAAVKRRKLST